MTLKCARFFYFLISENDPVSDLNDLIFLYYYFLHHLLPLSGTYLDRPGLGYSFFLFFFSIFPTGLGSNMSRRKQTNPFKVNCRYFRYCLSYYFTSFIDDTCAIRVYLGRLTWSRCEASIVSFLSLRVCVCLFVLSIFVGYKHRN